MEGRPVWLASLSLRDAQGNIKPAESWRPETLKSGENIIRKEILKGVGNERMERMFRMCMTLCFHRALSDEEIRALPESFMNTKPCNFAGGPLHVYFTKGIQANLPTIMPCKRPKKKYTDLTFTTYFVEDCEKCRPCKARIAMSQFMESLPWPLPEFRLYKYIRQFNRRLSRVQDIMVIESL